MTGKEGLSEDQLHGLFAELFPEGPAGADLMRELAPSGWYESPLRFCFHPTPQRLYEEAVGLHDRMDELFPDRGPAPAPTLEDVASMYVDPPLEPHRELAELMGKCLWDVFSDNNEVITPDGRSFDLGSFRATAGFIADWLNKKQLDERYDYMDFYIESSWIAGRADLEPVYQAIFRRLLAHGYDWVYAFPRLMLVDMRPLLESLGQTGPEWEGYDPGRAIEKSREDAEHERQVREMREQLDESYRQAVERASQGPPPPTVAAYRTVYGAFPQGWPPELPE